MGGGRLTYLIFTVLVFCGCARDSGVSGKLLIMEGNFQNARGDHTGAISSYMQALEYAQAAPYSEFGLGSVYFTMGEEKAALERFAHAEKMLETTDPAANRELQYRIHYNTGVVLFSEGDFSGATESFRQALKIDGGKKDAKRNLELSILSLARDNISGGGKNDGENESGENRSILFEYMRQKEFNQWKSREWQKEEDFSGLDY
jgi:Ca-activated chloride channel family protein